MRTTPEENAELGRRIARKLNGADGADGAVRPADGRLGHRRRRASRSTTPRPTRRCSPRCATGIDTDRVEVHEVDADINDPAFATAMADRLHELIQERAR